MKYTTGRIFNLNAEVALTVSDETGYTICCCQSIDDAKKIAKALNTMEIAKTIQHKWVEIPHSDMVKAIDELMLK